LGRDGTSGETAARAARIGSARLYRVDADALLDVREAIRLGGAATRDPRDMIALFDESLGAVMEARRARTALEHGASGPSPEAIEKIRSHARLAKLDEFGAKKGGPTGVEARAVARLLAANGFLKAARAREPVRRYATEPLVILLFAPQGRESAIGGGPREGT